MLLSKNVTKYGYFRIISHDSVTKIVNKYLTEERNVQSKRNLVGYLVLQPNKCLNEKSDLKGINHGLIAHFSSNSDKGYSADTELTPVQFEKVSDETLDSLTEYFDELIEKAAHLTEADVSYGDGVLTIKFGKTYGTYVINRQTPNKQIWLSSPKSGPKRYDFVNGKWIYKHDGKTLHELLNSEIPAIVMNATCFEKCSFSGKEKEAIMDTLQ
ncbi:frataxin isoform X1 [Nomia melanderi]|uniref:frataxin isoform X1 n=1 Tax=Nomia melanderi TaxID=2448451 RepID=UPI00130441B1|nr:frataxin homolog, mitochondrial isoform X1 [Nomia melanderi]